MARYPALLARISATVSEVLLTYRLRLVASYPARVARISATFSEVLLTYRLRLVASYPARVARISATVSEVLLTYRLRLVARYPAILARISATASGVPPYLPFAPSGALSSTRSSHFPPLPVEYVPCSPISHCTSTVSSSLLSAEEIICDYLMNSVYQRKTLNAGFVHN